MMHSLHTEADEADYERSPLTVQCFPFNGFLWEAI